MGRNNEAGLCASEVHFYRSTQWGSVRMTRTSLASIVYTS